MGTPAQPSAQPPAKRDWSDQRKSVRIPCLETSKRISAAIGDDFCLAKVRNISPEGISLVLGRAIETGQILAIDLIDTKTNRISRTLDLRVAWCIEHPSGDWILGGSFASRLTEEELNYFLK
jgi:hypothetical protein